jgi:hypothetical protein
MMLGRFRTFVAGPMCAINRTSAEPPSHLECARFAAKACPFLTKPRMRRNDKDLPEHKDAPGTMLSRNPGCCVIWTTQAPIVVKHQDRNGMLFDIGEPTSVEWWAEGRRATRDEVMASISSGLPILQKMAAEEGQDAIQQLGVSVGRAMALVPS